MGLRGTMSAWRIWREDFYVRVYLNTHQRTVRLYLEGDPGNDVQRVNDVAQRLAHLPSMGVSHHRMQINLEQKNIRIISATSSLTTLISCCVAVHYSLLSPL